MQVIDYYEVLGVSPNSDEVVIRAAYKAMMLKFHPDTSRAPGAEARAKAINEAFAVLGDPEKRKRYDTVRSFSDGAKASPPPPPPPPPPSDFAPASAADQGPNQTGGGYKPGGRVLGISLLLALWGGLVALNKASDNEPPDDAIAASEADAVEAPAAASSANPIIVPSPLAQNENQPIPTIGQFTEKIGTAVDEFSAILAKDGMMAAEAYSRDCQRAALRSNNILETDYCVAFDMSAMATDLGVSESLGMPQNQYFKVRAQSLDSDYARFQQASSNRTQVIWTEVNSVLDDSIKAAMIQSQR